MRVAGYRDPLEFDGWLDALHPAGFDPAVPVDARPALGPRFWRGVLVAFGIETAFVVGGLALAWAL